MVRLWKLFTRKLAVLCLTLAAGLAMCTTAFGAGNTVDWSFTKGPYTVAGDEAVLSDLIDCDSTPRAEVQFTVTSVTSPGTAYVESSRKDDNLWGSLFGTYTTIGEKEVPITSGSAGKNYARTVKDEANPGKEGKYVFSLGPDGHSLNMKVNKVYMHVEH